MDNDDLVDIEDDDRSQVSGRSHDESIFDGERDNEQLHSNDMEDNFDLLLTEEERELLMKKKLRSLQIFKKNIHPLLMTDLFVTGRERMKKSLAKTCQNALRKQERKRELIFLSIKYFTAQMESRRKILELSLIHI